MLLPQECRGVSKIRHLKIFWRFGSDAASFAAEVIGRCNGACINGVLYKEGGLTRLSEASVSCIAVGQSCYMFFAPARRTVSIPAKLLSPRSSSGEDDGSEQTGVVSVMLAPIPETNPVGGVKRFPKLWSKAIVDVFQSLGKFQVSQSELLTEFMRIHAVAVASYVTCLPSQIEEELWSKDLKRFVTKSPFEFDPITFTIKFDPSAVKPRKKPRIGSDDEGGQIPAPQALLDASDSEQVT